MSEKPLHARLTALADEWDDLRRRDLHLRPEVGDALAKACRGAAEELACIRSERAKGADDE